MESRTHYWLKLLTYSLFIFSLNLYFIFPLMAGAEEPSINDRLRDMEQQQQQQQTGKPVDTDNSGALGVLKGQPPGGNNQTPGGNNQTPGGNNQSGQSTNSGGQNLSEVLGVLRGIETQHMERVQYEKSLPKPEPNPEVLDGLKALEQQSREKIQYEKSLPNAAEQNPDLIKALKENQNKLIEFKKQSDILDKRDLLLNLPPDTVLATAKGDPLVYVDEFNKKVSSGKGKNLFDVRYQLLREIIDKKLIAELAKESGFGDDPQVKEKLRKAKSQVDASQRADQYVVEINDYQAQQYYKKNIEKFRQPDMGTRVLFVVKGTFNEASEILKQLKKGEPFDKYSFSTNPIFGTLMPALVQESIFHLEPGQLTEVIGTPIGFYIVKLVERNLFDQFKVSVIVKNTIQESQKTLKRIEAGGKFEDLITEKKNLSVALTKLPEEVQMVVPGMELHEVSQPISTVMGYFLVKLQERQSNAEIETAKLIRVNSKIEGEKILTSIKKGSPIGKVQEQKIAGKDIPSELRDVAKGLKEGEYSGPIKSQFGFYMIKVEKRVRQKFKPFDLVKEDITKMIKAETISDEVARKFYESHRSQYRKPGSEYFVDVILMESSNQGEKILAELKNEPEGEKKEALFLKYQKDLKEVPADLLPIACKDIVRDLKPSQASQVIATPLGYFILRLKRIESPVYFAFGDVQYKIKSSLVSQKTEQTKQRDKREVQIFITQIEEDALQRAYHNAYMMNIDKVSDREAEEWWLNNKNNFLSAFGIQQEGFELPTDGKTTNFKKRNLLLKEYKDIIKDQYVRKNVVIYEKFLY